MNCHFFPLFFLSLKKKVNKWTHKLLQIVYSTKGKQQYIFNGLWTIIQFYCVIKLYNFLFGKLLSLLLLLLLFSFHENSLKTSLNWKCQLERYQFGKFFAEIFQHLCKHFRISVKRKLPQKNFSWKKKTKNTEIILNSSFHFSTVYISIGGKPNKIEKYISFTTCIWLYVQLRRSRMSISIFLSSIFKKRSNIKYHKIKLK